MTIETNKINVRDFMERVFGQGDLDAISEYTELDGVDHQEPDGTNFIEHLKKVVVELRTAFPDLHFEIHEMIGEGDIVAFRSTMTGTHSGVFNMGPINQFPATGRKIAVPHMHFLRLADGKTVDLWHVWNIPMMMAQLGIMPQQSQSN